MKKRILTLILTGCVILTFSGCSGSASSATEPDSVSDTAKTDSATGTEELSEEEFDYHGLHLNIPSNLISSLNAANNPPDQYTAYSDSGVSWFSAMIHSDNVVSYVETFGETYSSGSAMIYYSIVKDTKNEYWPFEYEQTQIGGTDVLIGTVYKDEKWYTRAYVILENNSIELEYITKEEKYNDLIRKSLETIRIDDDEIPEIMRITKPENLQEKGLNTKAIETCGIYVNIPETYVPVANDDDSVVWVDPDGKTMIGFTLSDAAIMNMDDEDMREHLSGNPSFIELSHHSVTLYNGMVFSWNFYTTSQDDGTEIENCIVACHPTNSANNAVVMYGIGDENFEETVITIAETIRYADGWTNDFLEYDPIPRSEFDPE